MADEQAALARDDVVHERMRKPRGAKHFSNGLIQLETQKETVHGDVKKATKRAVTEDTSRMETMNQNEEWQSCAFDWVDWDSMEATVQKLKRRDCYKWMHITKLMNDILHTSVWAERFNGESKKCMECGVKEQQQHVI